ncbi:MAG TPA: dihydrolipoyl dehydrogenase [Candidatus Manganitrophaceae bacterium]|nr:dihydrolipoyl dehydrogenase [Candidatus Manganitrophaceae bacterium]
MSENKNYDVVILGGGPGGYVAAIRAGQLGLKVAVVEKEAVGGVCLHHGCIPSKAIIRNAEVLSLIQRSEEYGIKVENIRPDFGQAIDRSRKVIQKLYNGVQGLMKKNKVDVYSGIGKLIAPDRIEVSSAEGKKIIQGERTILATGSRVRSLPNLKVDGERIITSDEALSLRELPRSVAIVGGGAVGVEFAYVYAVYGAKVTIVEMAPSLLPLEDREVSALLERSFKKRGMEVLTGARVDSIKDRDGAFSIQIQTEEGGREIQAERILVAVGRAPNVEGIGLEAVGVALHEKSRAIQVDERMKTNVPNLFAIGDVTTRPALAHGAMAQGVAVVEMIAGIQRPPVDLLSIPNAVYCQPQVASVGLTEEKAKSQGVAIKVAKFPFAANGKAIALGETEGFVKIVSDAQYGEILGAHLIGPEATELIGEFVLAKTVEATALELKQAVHPHPTLSEAVMEAGGAVFNEAIHF